MPREVTPATTLENLKREAKRWLRAMRAADVDARARFARAFPGAPDMPTLRDVQHALALEHGLAGWTALTSALDGSRASGAPQEDTTNWFLENACPDHHVRGRSDHAMARHTAMRMLRRNPAIARANLSTAVVCGDLEEVERILAERPEAANERRSAPDDERSRSGGSGDRFTKKLTPKGWEPLLFLCFTRLPLAATNDNALDIARTLLDHGADPNAYFMAGDSRYTPLTGAIGEGEEDRPPHPQRDALVQLLLERGAEPYDGQVIYNIHFRGDVLWFAKLMYERAIQLGRKADWDDPSWSMLSQGTYGNGARWHLEIAIKKDDLKLAEWCLAHGADPNAPPAADQRFPQLTLHETATRLGSREIADLLVRYGAKAITAVPDAEAQFTSACFQLDRDAAQALVRSHPELLTSTGVIFKATKKDRVDVVTLLLDLGMSPDVEDKAKQRPLHIAGYDDAMRVGELLIARGAAIDPREANYGNTPLDCAVYYEHARMTALLARHSRDIWNLVYIGQVDRLREIIDADPTRARVVWDGWTPLMWLPDDEVAAIDIVKLFLQHGADVSIRNNEGLTAGDYARKRALDGAAALLSPDNTGRRHL
jgi:ankyrin repeat protein